MLVKVRAAAPVPLSSAAFEKCCKVRVFFLSNGFVTGSLFSLLHLLLPVFSPGVFYSLLLIAHLLSDLNGKWKPSVPRQWPVGRWSQMRLPSDLQDRSGNCKGLDAVPALNWAPASLFAVEGCWFHLWCSVLGAAFRGHACHLLNPRYFLAPRVSFHIPSMAPVTLGRKGVIRWMRLQIATIHYKAFCQKRGTLKENGSIIIMPSVSLLKRRQQCKLHVIQRNSPGFNSYFLN